MHTFNLGKCAACGEKIENGMFCETHARVVQEALSLSSVVDGKRLRAEAEQRLKDVGPVLDAARAAHAARAKGRP